MTIEQRIRRLERENRSMKFGGGGLLLALLVVLFGGAGQDEPKVHAELLTRKLAVVDEKGLVHFRVTCSDKFAALALQAEGPGSPTIMLSATGLHGEGSFAGVHVQGGYDVDAMRRATSEKESGKLGQEDWIKKAQEIQGAGVSITTSSEGANANSSMTLVGEKGETGISLREAGSKYGPSIQVGSGLSGYTFVTCLPSGGPAIFLRDKNEKIRAVMAIDHEIGCELALFDKTGEERACLGATKATKGKTGANEVKPESTLTLFSADGKVREQIPHRKL